MFLGLKLFQASKRILILTCEVEDFSLTKKMIIRIKAIWLFIYAI